MRKPNTVLPKLALAIGAPLIALGLVEGGFRVAGFSYEPSPMDLLVTGADALRDATTVDDDVFWTLKRSQRYRFADLEIVTNELGTRDALPPREKAPGTIRIVCLGDSTAFGGHTTYPAQLEQVLRGCAPDVKVEVINAGVPGWSTYQGVRLFERDLAQWRPDIVTASFGFNNAKREQDGMTDRQRAEATRHGARRLLRGLARSRFVQWLIQRRDARREPRAPFDATRDWLQLRCPPAEHARCLTELDAACREIGAKLLLATQPHGFVWSEGDAIGDLPPNGIKDVATRLDEQNAVVARSAAELRVGFVDVAAAFRALHPGDVFVDPLPGKDPLHTTAMGARRVAEALADAVLDAQWIAPRQRSPTRPYRTCGPIASLASDVDGDGRDEVLFAAVVDGNLRVRMFDPRTGVARELDAVLPTPDAAVELAQIPLLGNGMLLTVPVVEPDGNRLFVCDEAWRVTPLSGTVMALPRGAMYQALPLELTGDDAPEYGVCATGVGGFPWFVFMSSKGETLFDRTAKWQTWSAGVRMQAIDDGTGRGIQALALTPCTGPAFVVKASIDGKVETLLGPRRLGRFAPTELVAGRFSAQDDAERMLLIHAPLVVSWEREFLGAAAFPFGSGEFDRESPRPALCRVTRAGKPTVVLGSRVGGTIHLFSIDGGTIAPLATLPVPLDR